MSEQEDILSDSQSYQNSEDDVSSVESDYTPEWEDGSSKKVKYRVITEEKRKNLIELVHDQNVNIVKAAKKLGIKYSTAKTIYSVFLKEGRVVSKLKRGAKTKKLKAEPKKQKPAKKPKVADIESSEAEAAPQRRTRNAEKKFQIPYVEQVEVGAVNPKKAITDQFEPPLSKRTKVARELQGEETIKSQPANIEAKELNIPTKLEDVGFNPTIQNQLLLAKLNSLQALQRNYITQPPVFQMATPMQGMPKSLPQNFGMSSPNFGLPGLNPLNLQMFQNMWFQQGLMNPFQHKY